MRAPGSVVGVHHFVSGRREWDFLCECGHAGCRASILLTLDAYAALRRRGEPVLAAGHHEYQVARARRLGEAATAVRAQAEHQVKRARRILDDLSRRKG